MPKWIQWLKGWFKHYWKEFAILIGFLIDFSIWFYDFARYKIIDLQLGLTLIFVEVPIAVVAAWIASILFEQRGEFRMQRRSKQIESIEASLRTHYEQLIARMRHWRYDPSDKETNDKGERMGSMIFIQLAYPAHSLVGKGERPQGLDEDLKHLRQFDQA